MIYIAILTIVGEFIDAVSRIFKKSPNNVLSNQGKTFHTCRRG